MATEGSKPVPFIGVPTDLEERGYQPKPKTPADGGAPQKPINPENVRPPSGGSDIQPAPQPPAKG